MINSVHTSNADDDLYAGSSGYLRAKTDSPTHHIPGRIFAVFLLVMSSPLMAVLILLVRWTSRGPAIYKQTRVGLHGRLFTVCKLRTMRVDAEANSGPTWATQDDPRVTPVGAILRKLHLDELPQLWNVIRGEMALVGPRPERPEFTTRLERDIPGYIERTTVMPGITGLAQLNLPPDTDLQSVRRKLILDMEYVETANWWLDTRIMLCTALRAMGIRKTSVLRWFGVYRRVNDHGSLQRMDGSHSLQQMQREPSHAAVRH